MSNLNKDKDDYFEEKSSILNSIGGLITFSTIMPLNIYTRIEDMAKLTWFWPFISFLVGIIGAIISYFLVNVLLIPPIICAAIIYGFFLMFNGYHHLDGLLDFGDALMVHGTPEKKLAVMRDSMVGTGGIALFFIVGIITITSFNSILAFGLFGAIIVSEMAGKIGLISCCISSKPGQDGTGRFFIEFMTIPKYLLSVLIAIIISYSLVSYVGIFGVIGGIFGGALISYLGKKHFKIATGDVLGASNEVGRLFSLLVMVIAFTWI
ncbi:cobalamin synthase [Methanobrevibacter cuticularis]|uniref:Adenosylcobinamide-GDP ribazoletransferase n=1 Tax=Methanobrevibacter cuticularis TaxID=47311 RepID=A0A166F3N4_9EURY|nr:adenosylcobinamide-GDP ribazoletransferase [Methanobrevibacter cuticularis]KZX17282.1 cobalamin synthase [Methanobrevibacter cuticularis]